MFRCVDVSMYRRIGEQMCTRTRMYVHVCVHVNAPVYVFALVFVSMVFMGVCTSVYLKSYVCTYP